MNQQTPKNITADTVKYVADLSRLKFDEEDLDMFCEQLSEILTYIAQLDELDTSDVEPTSHTVRSVKNVFREDKKGESLPVEEALASSPAKESNFFKVPKIIREQ